METKTTKEYIYFRESAFQSILGDAFSIGSASAMLLANRYFLGDKWYIAAFALFLFFAIVMAKTVKSRHTFTNLQEMKDFVAAIKK